MTKPIAKGATVLSIGKKYTAEEEQLILDMIIEGKSNREIGAKLGVSRNAIAGKRGRMGFTARHKVLKTEAKPIVTVHKEPWCPVRDGLKKFGL